jgi:hypothetical protein
MPEVKSFDDRTRIIITDAINDIVLSATQDAFLSIEFAFLAAACVPAAVATRAIIESRNRLSSSLPGR